MFPVISLLTPDAPNLDLGRPLQRSDIVSASVHPLDSTSVGTFCYLCQDPVGRTTGLTALTKSSGVFTSLVLCDMDAPVYVCLEHIPGNGSDFEAFTPAVAAELRAWRAALAAAELETL